MHAERRPGGPFMALNGERHEVITDSGQIIQPPSDHPEAIRMSDFTVDGRTAHFTLQQPVRMNKRFMRGLQKIGFQLLCFRKGPQYVLDRRYDPLRAYIRYGKGTRRMVLTTSGGIGSWEQPRFSLQQIPQQNDWIAILQLGSTFYIDLTPYNDLYRRVKVQQLRANNMALWSDAGGGKLVDGP